jgi:hypothetical protein
LVTAAADKLKQNAMQFQPEDSLDSKNEQFVRTITKRLVIVWGLSEVTISAAAYAAEQPMHFAIKTNQGGNASAVGEYVT